MKTNIKNNNGFTLLEAMVAISILMVAVVAPITIAQKGLSSAVYSKNQMIASYLAQDALEYIKNVRDENIKNSQLWLESLDSCVGESKYCQIDTIKPVTDFGVVKPYNSAVLSLDSNGFYGYDGGTPTNFMRKINIIVDPFGNNSDEAQVTATVSWNTDKVEVKTLIYNY